MKTDSILWLLPIVFMVHDLEEIIMMRPWLDANSPELIRRFPRIFSRLMPHFQKLSTSAFAAGVAVIFLMLSMTTLICVEFRLYNVWTGVMIAFFIHLIAHILQFIVFGRYVPVILTSLLSSSYCVYALAVLPSRVPLNWSTIGLWTSFSLIVIMIVMPMVHKFASRFDVFLHGKFFP